MEVSSEVRWTSVNNAFSFVPDIKCVLHNFKASRREGHSQLRFELSKGAPSCRTLGGWEYQDLLQNDTQWSRRPVVDYESGPMKLLVFIFVKRYEIKQGYIFCKTL